MGLADLEITNTSDRLACCEAEICNIIQYVRETRIYAKGKNANLKKRCITVLKEGDKLMQKLQRAVETEPKPNKGEGI